TYPRREAFFDIVCARASQCYHTAHAPAFPAHAPALALARVLPEPLSAGRSWGFPMPDDYAALLKRARAKVPATVGTGERFVMPVADLQQEGKTTIVRNMAEILDKLNRSSDHMVPILLRELGTAGSYDDGRLVLQG